MKRFISTKFFLSLREASQKSVNIDIKVLENEYDKFALLLFSETALLFDKTVLHNSLCFAKAELVFCQSQSSLKKK